MFVSHSSFILIIMTVKITRRKSHYCNGTSKVDGTLKIEF